MKICIITHNVLKGDGQGRVNYEIVWEAIRRGHEVTLLATSVAPDLQQSDRVHWILVKVKGIPTQLLSNMIFSWKSARWLKQYASMFDLIKVNGALTSIAADVNAVHFVHSSWLRSPAHISRQRRDYYGVYQWFYTWLNAQWEKQTLRQASTIVAVSEKVKRELVEVGVPANTIRIILNGVDLQEFFPGSSDRSQWGLPNQIPVALFVGDIRSSRKNLDTVLRALVHVPDLHLAVVGKLEGSPYPKLVETLELTKRVHFLGFRRDVAEIMRATDLFVFPSRYEACTLVLFEAMASGLPVITAITAGGCEVVTAESGIVLLDSEDVNGLAEAMNLLAKNPLKRQQMGQASRAIVQQYGWDSVAKSYVDLFEELGS